MITEKFKLEDVTETVLNIMKEELDIKDIDTSETIKNLDIDSLTFAELMVNIEDSFDAEFDLDEKLNQQDDLTVQNLIEAIYEGLNQ
jgi:acyl carrier protein